MKLVLFDINEAMCEAWCKAFPKDPGVKVFHGSLDDLMDEVQPDIVSSAGNAYGILGTGIDGAIRQKWPHAQGLVKARIAAPPLYGEMPVGYPSIIVPVEDYVSLAYTPTMLRPGTENLPPVSVYFAMRGLMSVVRDMPVNVAVPGMGTGIGGLDPKLAAKAQHQAWKALKH